ARSVSSRAAVITGCGAVSPLGVGVRALWNGLLAGRTAIAPITGFPADDLVPRSAAEVRHVARTDPDRAGAFALAAAAEALAVAALETRTLDARRVGVVLAGRTDLLCRVVVSGFDCLKATADVAWPFDAARRGLVLGEGAALVLVEEAGHAARRGARVCARVLGVGAAADATHMTAPD